MEPKGPGKKVLIVEDDPSARSFLREILGDEGHRVIEADGIHVGLALFRKEKPDLVVLDVNLPDGKGWDLCKEIRAHESLAGTPVIMLTANAQVEDKVFGLEAGADQYLTKPVHALEFRQWVRALLRRLRLDKDEADCLEVDDLSIDIKGHVLRFRGELIPDLTARELQLLAFLVRKSPQALTRKYIISCLWRTVAVDHLVDTHLTNLRRKLPQALSDRIQNVPGRGFRYLPQESGAS